MLHAYDWPGNLRQLENVAGLASVLAEGAPFITVNHLPEEILGNTSAPARNLSDATRDMIEHVLLSHQGNVTAAAKELGISRTTLYKRLALR
ncbi:helix-turn-helix domain-containing protein [Pseudomonas fluorescens]|uniref:helix-turn-helix domain-containing protein n=1 Tax=Pseudomonas fluorescens TaxID=294 RepID=UPI003220792C